MSDLYHQFLYVPMYNALIGIFNVLPWVDAGIAVMLMTLLVRVVLFPLSKKAVVSQVKMQELAPMLEEIKAKYSDKEVQARETLDLYKKTGANPFSGIFVLLIQIPVFIALYHIFLHAGFPAVDTTLLYSFVQLPDTINTEFLGLIDVTKKSVPLAFLAALTTYFQLRLATRRPNTPRTASFGDDLSRSMQTQMKYVFPVLIFFIAYKFSGVVALYLLATNLFTIALEVVVRRRLATQVLVPKA